MWSDPAAAPRPRVIRAEVDRAGIWVPLDPDETYGMVTNNYLRGGGDGYDMFEAEGMDAYDFGPGLAEVLAQYMARYAPCRPFTDGRITMK
ncbi:MAG: 5'-nucleotidase C-terminal domain-containing protein [Rhodobacterales bacterium]